MENCAELFDCATDVVFYILCGKFIAFSLASERPPVHTNTYKQKEEVIVIFFLFPWNVQNYMQCQYIKGEKRYDILNSQIFWVQIYK